MRTSFFVNSKYVCKHDSTQVRILSEAHVDYENMTLTIDMNLSDDNARIFTSYPKYMRKFLTNPNFVFESFTKNQYGLILDITGQIPKKNIIIGKRVTLVTITPRKREDIGNMDAEFSDPDQADVPYTRKQEEQLGRDQVRKDEE
jgi:hypothetical protein